MAITLVGATEATSTTDTVTINVPAGVQDNDLLYLVACQTDGEDGSWNSLAGWMVALIS